MDTIQLNVVLYSFSLPASTIKKDMYSNIQQLQYRMSSYYTRNFTSCTRNKIS